MKTTPMYEPERPKENLEIMGSLSSIMKTKKSPDTQGSLVHETHEPTPELYEVLPAYKVGLEERSCL